MAGRITLRTKLRELIAAHFPGGEFKIEQAAGGRLGGTLVWDGFVGKDQVARQGMLRQTIRGALTAGDQLAFGAILTLTPSELAVMSEN